MNCYFCGQPLGADSYCHSCGVSVREYKIAAKASNAWYNHGLRKAQVRDLTGAVESLKISLSLNKKNVDARNLLGLVLLELGDTVEALSHWVISKNTKPDDNLASEYMAAIQSNQNRFEMVTKSIMKYNRALEYAKGENYDMAMIQLRKVIAVNPKLSKAQLLMALIYMKNKEYSKAKKTLRQVLSIDKSNALALYYMRAIHNEEMELKKNGQDSFLPKRKVKEVESAPLSGNDVIMPQSTYKEPSNGAITIIYILLGVLIGAAMIWFLITPARYRGMTEEYQQSVKEYSEKLSTSNVELNELQRQLNEVTAEKDKLNSRLDEVEGEGGTNKVLGNLISSANAYLANDIVASAESLVDIKESDLPSDSAKALYNTLSKATVSSAGESLYNSGMQQYRSGNFADAASTFNRAYEVDSSKVDAVYYAARANDLAGETKDAVKYYTIIVDRFASSSYVDEAKKYISEHN